MSLAGWIGFGVFVLLMLAIDLGVLHRKHHAVRFKEALIASVVWVTLALLFNLGIYFCQGLQPALTFLTGYLIEQSLSVDNLFIFLLIFSYFKVPAIYQHTILFWGIIGAILMRAVFIVAGIGLLHHFHWITYVFGLFLILTGIKLAKETQKEIHPERNPALKFLERFMPITHSFADGKFFIRKDGRLTATTLFVVLLVVETTDLIFAVDSIPAILGLRSLYFVLAKMLEVFHHLHYGLAVILTFVGVKMLFSGFLKIPTAASLIVVLSVLILSILSSLIWPAHRGAKKH